MRSIESMEEYFTQIRRSEPSLMIFSANWCPDCRYLDRFIDEVEAKYQDRMTFFRVDRDAFPELCDTLDILGIPSLIAYESGVVKGRFVSKLRKSQPEVEAFLAEVLDRMEAPRA